jgi:peroxiredoxin
MTRSRQFRAPVLALLLAMSFVSAALAALPRTGQSAPNFKAVTTSGQAISLDNYRGHVLVIDFFAPWCLPCRDSTPHLVEMNRKYGKQGLQVLGLNADDDGDRSIKSFADEFRINYPVAAASEKIQTDFGIRSVPVMFVIDKKGAVAEVYRGFNDEISRSMERLIKRLLAEK